eukprot:COSAG02_NODE_4494_length_5295_cov_3.064088_1_plen_67_part_00
MAVIGRDSAARSPRIPRARARAPACAFDAAGAERQVRTACVSGCVERLHVLLPTVCPQALPTSDRD